MPQLVEPTAYSVAGFNELVNATLGEHIGDVLVTGEVAGVSVRQGKWLTFTLRDESSTLNCFGVVQRLGVPVEEGMHVRVLGSPRIYVPYGKYSFTVEAVEPIGAGALQRAYQLLLAKLKAEGLFDDEHKQQLPAYPARIGLITSKDGAALGDVRKVLGERWGGFSLTLAPVTVQGISAPRQIIGALRYFNEQHPVDVILLTRGGGAAEDLQAFNDERVARAVFASRTPVIAAIGHEQDVTIAELVADMRAATPSNAAQHAVPDWRTILAELTALQTKQVHLLEQRLVRARKQIDRVVHLYALQRQRAHAAVERATGRVTQLQAAHAYRRQRYREILARTKALTASRVHDRLRNAAQRLDRETALLRTLNPSAILRRGYTFTVDKASGRILTSVDALQSGQRIETKFHDGSREAEVI